LKNNDLIKSTSDSDEAIKLKFEDISFVKLYSELSTICIVTKNSTSKQVHRNKDIMEALETHKFIKINHDTMINPVHTKGIIDSKKRSIEMKCGNELHVSRRKWHLVKYYIEFIS
jgi:DNA-binding LytR/AlgR family response regulator